MILTQSYAFAPTVFGRFWFRMTNSNQKGNFIFSNLEDVGGSPMIMLRMKANTRQIDVVSANNLGKETTKTIPFNPPLFSWHLFEFQVEGIGTTAGTARLWIDGELQTTITNNFVDLEGRIYTVGEPVSEDSTFAGTLHFDDIRLNSSPQASQWALAAPSTASVGACTPVTASLKGVLDGAEAPAPFSLTADLSSTGVTGGFYSDAGCATPATTLPLAAGATSAKLYYRADSVGTAVLKASQVDFLPGSLSLVVSNATVPPATGGSGSPGEEGSIQGATDDDANPDVHSSCSSASGPGLSPLLLLALFHLVRLYRQRT